MDVADLDAFVDRLIVLAEIFTTPLSAAAQVLYFETLSDLPTEGVFVAISMCAKTCTFMPKPAEIRERVIGNGGDPELTVEAAWLHYKQLAVQVGAYGSPTVEDPTLADALLAIFGSWEAACWTELTPEMWASKRKEFGRVYRLLRERPGVTGSRTLIGFVGRTNTERYGVPDPLHLELPEGSLPRKLLSPAVTTNERGVLDAREAEREAQRVRWRANVQRAIEAHTTTKES
jgi:hypothetical protein